MSPELFKYKPYSYKSDIWALGCIMYEICNRRHAFDAENLNGLAIKILKGNYNPIDSQYSKPLRALIDQMLNIKPANRPTIEEILDKAFIKKKLVAYVINLHKSEAESDVRSSNRSSTSKQSRNSAARSVCRTSSTST